jgi:hypothetical protein
MPPTEVSIETHLAFLRRPQGRPKCFDLGRPDQQGCRGSAQLLILRSAMVVRNSSREFYPSTASGWLDLGNTPVPESPPTGSGDVMSIRDSGNAGQRCLWWICPRGAESARPPHHPGQGHGRGRAGIGATCGPRSPRGRMAPQLAPRPLTGRASTREGAQAYPVAGWLLYSRHPGPARISDHPVSKRGTKQSAAVSNM